MLFWRASAGHAFLIRGHWHQFSQAMAVAAWQSAIAEISLVVLLILTIILCSFLNCYIEQRRDRTRRGAGGGGGGGGGEDPVFPHRDDSKKPR
jgi:hypothetical protein